MNIGLPDYGLDPFNSPQQELEDKIENNINQLYDNIINDTRKTDAESFIDILFDKHAELVWNILEKIIKEKMEVI